MTRCCALVLFYIYPIMKGGFCTVRYLLIQYRETLSKVEKARKNSDDLLDRKNLGSASSDLRYCIEYMKTGRRPGCRRGVTRQSTKQREVPYDPHSFEFVKMAALNRNLVSALSQHQRDLLADLLEILTYREREAFELVRGQGYSFGQAAELLCVTKGTVQNLVDRAEKKLHFVVRKPPISERGISEGAVLKNTSQGYVQRVMFNEPNQIPKRCFG